MEHEAFTEEEILHIVFHTVEIAKPFINKNGSRSRMIEKVKDKWPEFYDGYNKNVDEYEDILVHSMKGVFPAKLFAESAPNQEQKEFEYVKRNYKNTTLPVFGDYVSTVSRPWHRSNWSIRYKKDEDQFIASENTLQAYLEKEVPVYNSLESFMKNVMPALKARDAEGVIAVKPDTIPTIDDPENEGERIIDPTELVDPIPVYYNVRQRVTDSVDHVMVLLKEKSLVFEGNKKMRVGLIFEFYDRDNIWRITQFGRRIDFTFKAELYFNHGWDEVPVYKLMGIPTAEDDKVFYQSPFLFAVPNLDLVTIYQSDLQSSIKKCAFPYRIMIGDVCEFTDENGTTCDRGQMVLFDEDKQENISRHCPECNGSGLKSRISRLGEMLLRPDSSIEGGGETSMSVDPMKYVSPEVDTLQFMRSEIIEHEGRARNNLHLTDSSTRVTASVSGSSRGNELAVTKVLDSKAMSAFISPISDQMFFLYKNVIRAIGWMRYGEFFNNPELTVPTTFDFSTEQDYVTRISEAVKAGVPPLVVRAILMQFIQTIYVSDEEQEKVFRLIDSTDRLLAISGDEIALKISRGTAAPWEDVLHCSATTLIMDLMQDDEDFLEKKLEEQKQALIDSAKKRVTDIASSSSDSQVDNILGT